MDIEYEYDYMEYEEYEKEDFIRWYYGKINFDEYDKRVIMSVKILNSIHSNIFLSIKQYKSRMNSQLNKNSMRDKLDYSQ